VASRIAVNHVHITANQFIVINLDLTTASAGIFLRCWRAITGIAWH